MNGRCPAEPSLISLYLWNCLGFPWCLCAVLLPGAVCCRIQIGVLSFSVGLSRCCWQRKSCLSFVLVKRKREVVLQTPDPAQKPSQMETGTLFVSCCIPLMYVSSHIHFSACTAALVPAQREERSGVAEVEMLPWAVTVIKMMMWLPVMLLWVFKQAGAHLPCEEEAGKKLSHSFLYRFSKSLPKWEVKLAGPCCMIP